MHHALPFACCGAISVPHCHSLCTYRTDMQSLALLFHLGAGNLGAPGRHAGPCLWHNILYGIYMHPGRQGLVGNPVCRIYIFTPAVCATCNPYRYTARSRTSVHLSILHHHHQPPSLRRRVHMPRLCAYIVVYSVYIAHVPGLAVSSEAGSTWLFPTAAIYVNHPSAASEWRHTWCAYMCHAMCIPALLPH